MPTAMDNADSSIILLSRHPDAGGYMYTGISDNVPGTTGYFPHYTAGHDGGAEYVDGKFKLIMFPTKVLQMSEASMYLDVLAIGHVPRVH